MNLFNSYIVFIFILKVIFILLVVYNLFLKIKGESQTKKAKMALFYKERVEYLFKVFMAILLIYLFSPTYNNLKLIDEKVKILLYLYGFVLLVTADWSVFIKDSLLYKKLTSLVS